MIPLKDENPTRRPALLTYGLIILNLAIYFYVAQSPVMDAAVIRRYAMIPADIAAGHHLGTLLSSLFLHASLLQVVADPTSEVPTLGASGAISGVLAAYVLFYPRARVLTFIVPFFLIRLSAMVFIGYWIALQALNAYLSLGVPEGGGGVAFFAHVGGFVSGLILAWLLKPPFHYPLTGPV